MSRSLIVVRGSYRGTDPAYACMGHDTKKNHYLMLEMEDGNVAKRTIVPSSDRKIVENAMNNGVYRGVHVDKRADPALLSLRVPSHAMELDFSKYRRAKSDSELFALQTLSEKTHQLLRKDVTNASFRGEATVTSNKYAHKVDKYRGFTQYRAGIQDSMGRCSDLTHVEPRTNEWKARMTRTYRGLDAVEAAIKEGVSVRDLNNEFMKHMDSDFDKVYGNVVHHTGFEGHEDLPIDELQVYDFVTVGAAIGDCKGETALVYRSGVGVYPEEPIPQIKEDVAVAEPEYNFLEERKRLLGK